MTTNHPPYTEHVTLPVVLVPVGGAGAQTAPAAPDPMCDGETAAVLVDASSEPDLYAAYLLAGTLNTDCLVDAGERTGPLPDETAAHLTTSTLTHGYAIGGTAAVPPAKLAASLSWRRAGGADRWATLRIIGNAAADPTALPAAGDTTSPPAGTGGPPPADCDGDTAAVLVDASSEPDLYAAYLLAGTLDTDCLVDAGDRTGPLPDSSATHLAASTLTHGYAVGGTTAVPPAKLAASLTWRRAGGADRWATLRIIGNAAADPTTLPTHTPPEPTNNFSAITAGLNHTCALRTTGQAACWGYDEEGQATPPDGTFIAITAGAIHTCGLRTTGRAECWGNAGSDYGLLGYPEKPPSGTFTAITAGSYHTCGLRTTGEAVCWGDSQDRQLATADGTFQFGDGGPVATSDGTFTAITTGGSHTCALRTTGKAECWGNNKSGQATPPDGTFTAITAGSYHTCALRTTGEAVCWGGNVEPDPYSEGGNTGSYGQASPPDGTFIAITAGAEHTCGLRPTGKAQCWGRNERLEFGGELTGYDTVVVGQATPPDGTFTAITAGNEHTCGLRTTGEAVCWGDDEYGQATTPAG